MGNENQKQEMKMLFIGNIIAWSGNFIKHVSSLAAWRTFNIKQTRHYTTSQ